MRYVVAGAGGFIGSHLAERLLIDGHEVVGLDNFITGQRRNLDELKKYTSFTLIEQNISDPFRISGPVDVIFNFACPASPADFHQKSLDILRVCSQGTQNLLNVAQEKGAIFVQASTSECYGDALVHPQVESYWGNVNPVGERSAYDEGKRYAEALVMAYHRKHGLRTRIGRIFNTYGPRMRVGDGRVLPNFIQQALTGQPLSVYGEGKQTRSFCYVIDLVDGFVRLSQCNEVMPINIGNPTEISIIDLAKELIELIGSKSAIQYLPLPADDPKVRRPDITRARTLLKWEPQTERSVGLKATVEYFRTVLKTPCPS